MIKWQALSRAQKVLTGIAASLAAVVAIAGFVAAGYSHFMTDVEAQEQHQEITDDFQDYQKQQYVADKQDRLDRVQREVDRLEYDLLDAELTVEQREYKKRLINRQEAKTVCIQEDKC
jgi:hypothetical protein